MFVRVTARLTIPEFVVQPGNVTVKELGALELVCTIKGKSCHFKGDTKQRGFMCPVDKSGMETN